MRDLVFDVGGSKIRLAYSTDGRRLRGLRVVTTPRTWPQALKIFQIYLKSHTLIGRLRLVVGGLPAMLDRGQRMHSAPHLPGWVGKPIKQDLQKLTGVGVHLENDAALGGLGEAKFGRGRGFKIIGYLPIGTGVGGVRIDHGRIDARARGFEPGHQIISRSKTGRPLTLEQLISGSNIRRRFGKSPKSIKSKRIWQSLATELAYGLVNVIELWSPNIVVLGGGLMAAFRQQLPLIRRVVRVTIVETYNLPPIVEGTLGDKAALYGGLALARAHQRARVTKGS